MFKNFGWNERRAKATLCKRTKKFVEAFEGRRLMPKNNRKFQKMLKEDGAKTVSKKRTKA